MGDFVSIDQPPAIALQQQYRKGGASCLKDPINVVFGENVVPIRSEKHYIDVFFHSRSAVHVGTSVNEYPILWPGGIDQGIAESFIVKHVSLKVVFLEERYCRDGVGFVIKLEMYFAGPKASANQ